MSRLEAEFRPAVLADADALAENLRLADQRELTALGHADFREVLRESLARSTLSAAVVDAHGLVALLGVAPLRDSVLTPWGAPWLLGSPRCALHTRTLVARGPAYTRAMLAAYPRLTNMVHESNTLHRRWLARVGFKFRQAPVVLPNGERFLVFDMTAHNV